MTRNLLSYSPIERLKLSNLLATVIEKYGYPPTSPEAMQEAIPILREKIALNPNEWLFWFTLADYYLSLDKYIHAFDVAERFYQLQPNEPRSAYSLATVLRTLLNARYLNNPKIQDVNAYLSQSGLPPIDPIKCQDALDIINLTVEQAAEKAVSLFQELLSSGIDSNSREHIREILRSMYDSFPEMKDKPRSSYKPG